MLIWDYKLIKDTGCWNLLPRLLKGINSIDRYTVNIVTTVLLSVYKIPPNTPKCTRTLHNIHNKWIVYSIKSVFLLLFIYFFFNWTFRFNTIEFHDWLRWIILLKNVVGSNAKRMLLRSQTIRCAIVSLYPGATFRYVCPAANVPPHYVSHRHDSRKTKIPRGLYVTTVSGATERFDGVTTDRWGER